ncbi:MAG TPA: hypothetical protein VJ183_05255 [Chloroflexia bacterium]|nr:hypothetical protein [Chloroflexia bacterium]
MAAIMAAVVRALVGAIGATRYLVTIILVLIVLFYALLTQLQVVPVYSELAARLGMATTTFFILLYLLVLATMTLVWYFWILRPVDSMRAQLSWRGVYRQTDRTGTGWLNVAVLIMLASGVYVALSSFSEPALRDGALFLGIVIAIPMLIDFLPAQRPRRIVTSANDHSLMTIASRLTTNQTTPANVLNSLVLYNQIDPRDPYLAGPDLPDGMRIEIPPRF